MSQTELIEFLEQTIDLLEKQMQNARSSQELLATRIKKDAYIEILNKTKS